MRDMIKSGASCKQVEQFVMQRAREQGKVLRMQNAIDSYHVEDLVLVSRRNDDSSQMKMWSEILDASQPASVACSLKLRTYKTHVPLPVEDDQQTLDEVLGVPEQLPQMKNSYQTRVSLTLDVGKIS